LGKKKKKEGQIADPPKGGKSQTYNPYPLGKKGGKGIQKGKEKKKKRKTSSADLSLFDCSFDAAEGKKG